MNKILMTSLLMLMVVFSGCVTTRGVVTLGDSKVLSQQDNLHKTAIIKIIEDDRVFEDKPKTPNIPSLKGGLAQATEDDKAKAIARKRNGYGKALGDILLREGTVTSTVQKRVVSALNQSGYRVVPATAENNQKADLIISVKINKFWSWVELGFWSGKLNSEIETTILNEKNPAKETVVNTKITKSIQFATGSMWIKNTNLALDDYEAKLVSKLKQLN
ncbi:flagellar biosynthesis protein [Acinetobacter higginsii]|uniref:flagellar biosynthesis protein n=1 Tax=Acinetobacter higginsii TaxID=70347 RepID=UPI001F604F11|nr:flagellar biosynthesis protein [Acinetobacter higginsii]MCI3878436.1 flagellar biosynthesis protein [Acinetobacter higginsii]MDO3664822.1 flagellar biosynthesis protein [Acinetobacter higginsii]